MIIEASSIALGLSMGRGNGILKLILLGYANHADKHGRVAYPSTQTIADYAECDVRVVQRHVGWLLANYLHEGDQRMVDHLDPRYRPIVYDVAMSAEQIEQWATGTGPDRVNRARAAEAGQRGGRASPRAAENLVQVHDGGLVLAEDQPPGRQPFGKPRLDLLGQVAGTAQGDQVVGVSDHHWRARLCVPEGVVVQYGAKMVPRWSRERVWAVGGGMTRLGHNSGSDRAWTTDAIRNVLVGLAFAAALLMALGAMVRLSTGQWIIALLTLFLIPALLRIGGMQWRPSAMVGVAVTALYLVALVRLVCAVLVSSAPR